MKHFYIFIFCFFTFGLSTSIAQELNVKLAINASRIQSVDQQQVKEIEDAIRQMLNEKSWSNAKFEESERIDCTVNITLNTMPSENSFSGEIHIATRRPVYNSIYITSLLNYRDTKFDFNYIKGQILEYNEISLDNNIVATIAFYINIILGLDFDSFSPNGGQIYFNKALDIANKAQTLGARGWEAFDGKSRYDLALALTEESSKSFHSLWYNYHRLGLDEMAGNPLRGRLRIIETIKDLEALHAARPNSILLTLFSETKLEELLKICEEATLEEKRDVKERLKKIFPAKRSQIDNLR